MKTHILIQSSSVGSSGYNANTNKFEWLNIDCATQYTIEQALVKRSELIKPLIDRYNNTGETYKEIIVKPL